MPITIPMKDRSQYYHLEGNLGKFCDTLEKPKYFCKRVSNEINGSSGTVKIVLVVIPVFLLIYPISLAGRLINRVIYLIKGEKITKEAYRKSLYDWQMKEWASANPELSRIIPFFVDGCIRHRIYAANCPFEMIAEAKDEGDFFGTSGWFGCEFDSNLGKLIEMKKLLILRDVPRWYENLINQSSGKYNISSFNDRYKTYVNEAFKDFSKRGFNEQNNPMANKKLEINHCSTLLFRWSEIQFDLNYADEVRQLFQKQRLA